MEDIERYLIHEENMCWIGNKITQMFSQEKLSDIDEMFLEFWMDNYGKELINYVN